MKNEIVLPNAVTRLWRAHEALRKHFAYTNLAFTLDGKLVGDIGEAVASKAFGIKLCGSRTPGVDGHARNGRSVQIKATGKSNGGPAFTPGEGVAEHLLFLRLDFKRGIATVVYNGPEAPIRRLLPKRWSGTKVIPLSKITTANEKVPSKKRLGRSRS